MKWPLAVAALLASLVAWPAAATPAVPEAAGVEGPASLTDAGGALLLPGTAVTGTVADISGDGAREVVRLVPTSQDEAYLSVEAWTEHDGEWRRYDAQPSVRRAVARQAPHTWWQTPDHDGLLPLRVDEPARLVSWSDGHRQRLLLMGIGSSGLETACCLAIHEVVAEHGELHLVLVEAQGGAASEVHAADMSGDGADELIVIGPSGAGQEGRLRVLGWTGDRFELVDEISIPSDRSAALLADTDGRPGAEVLLSGRSPAPVVGGRAWSLLRVSLQAGLLTREQARPPVVVGPGLISAGPGDAGLLITDFDGTTVLTRWPAGERLSTEARAAVRGYPLAVVGGHVLLLEGNILTGERQDRPLLRLLDDRLQTVRQVTSTKTALELRTLSAASHNDEPRDGPRSGPWPYVGELPGALPGGQEAFIFNGRLVAAERDEACRSECLRAEPMAPLPGMAPIGVAGREGGWVALARSERAFIDVNRNGGSLRVTRPSAGAWSLAPSDVIFGARPATRPALEHRGAARDASMPGVLLATAGGLRTELSAPPGSSVYVRAPAAVEGPHLIGSTGRLLLSIPPSSVDEDPARIPVQVVVVTPDGMLQSSDLEVAVLPEPPELQMEVSAPALSLSALLSGQVSRLATLSIDGEPMAVDADGRFAAEIGAGAWPRTLTVEAVDPFGRRTRQSVSVAGVVDHRRLPWPAIILGLTITAAGALYLRGARVRRVDLAGDGSVILEELSGERQHQPGIQPAAPGDNDRDIEPRRRHSHRMNR